MPNKSNPSSKPKLSTQSDIEEIMDNEGTVIGHKCKGGFPFKGEGSYNKALAQMKAMKKK